MEQPVGLLIAFIALVAVLCGLFATASALFPRLVWLSQRAAEESPGRSLLIGAVNTGFLLAIALTLFASQRPILTFLGGVVAAVGLAGLSIGLAGLVTMVGKRLARQGSSLSEILAGTAALSLAVHLSAGSGSAHPSFGAGGHPRGPPPRRAHRSEPAVLVRDAFQPHIGIQPGRSNDKDVTFANDVTEPRPRGEDPKRSGL
jgi:hypothetical protein